jgi:uncharacterized protein (DUF433 family)
MTVGQLIATMRAYNTTPEETAEDFDLPLEQVLEAIAYYEANRELVDKELRSEKQRLREAGYPVEPADLSR